MTGKQRFLRDFLRVVGTAGLFALPCALMPESWMDAIHQWLGLGRLPTEPIVGYLARSTSLFYAMIGGLMWVLSGDLYRYRGALCYFGAAGVVFGLVLFAADVAVGLPLWWSVGEGISNVMIGGLVLVLSWQLPIDTGPYGERQVPDAD